ncbi:hypothetical protein G7Y79_00027g060920 [Physcia stellaris]|nr:hypothetical protein G7Y79_00027g060920 [Physcia stellaris]
MGRHLHLLHHVYAKSPTPLLANLPVKKLSGVELSCTLTDISGGTKESTVGLKELLPLIKPNHWPELKPPKATGGRIDISGVPLYRYRIKPLGASDKIPSVRECKRAGRSKEIMLTTDLHPKSVKHFLRLAYALLLAGFRVEFHLRPKVNKLNLTVDWALGNLPYLRPEVILRCMPEETQLIVPPVENVLRLKSSESSGKRLQEIIWAFSRRPEDLAKKNRNPGEIPEDGTDRWSKGYAKYKAAVRASRDLLESQADSQAEREDGGTACYDTKAFSVEAKSSV